jgi:hypothetical protein
LRLQKNPWAVLALIAAGTLICLYALDRYQHRFVQSTKDLIELLPRSNATVFYAEVNTLRRAGILSLLTGSNRPTEAEYASFVQTTHFDYSRDLDAVAGAVSGDNVLLALQGRFDWVRIRTYVQQQGGTCTNDSCCLPAQRTGNYVNLIRIQPDVIGVALQKHESLRAPIYPRQQHLIRALPPEPVWIGISPALLKNPASLPVALRIFAISLQPADSVLIALGPTPADSAGAFEIRLRAQCPSAASAETVKSQFEIETKMLKLELSHEHEQPNPADLTGLMTSGTFATNGNELTGKWLVRKELLKTLQQ